MSAATEVDYSDCTNHQMFRFSSVSLTNFPQVGTARLHHNLHQGNTIFNPLIKKTDVLRIKYFTRFVTITESEKHLTTQVNKASNYFINALSPVAAIYIVSYSCY